MTTHASISQRRRKREQGSALLIVFVFAAIIGIMLYRELPISIFEAQRQKEQLLVDRGHEYVRAVQLFYRRNHGQYPASIEQLESSNNIRYLRRRYKDPFTGEDNWRLLHAGPGGVLIDSKLNRTGLPGAPNTTASQAGGSAFSGSSLSGSAQNEATASGSMPAGGRSGSSAARNSDSLSWNDAVAATIDAPAAQTRQRPPAIAANGSGGTAGQLPPTTAELNASPDTPLLPPSSDVAAAGVPGASGATAANGSATLQARFGASAQVANGTSAQGPNVMQTLSPLLGSPTTPPQSNTGASAIGSAQLTTQSGTTGLGNMGQMNGGGALAGVASKAKGHGIKVINDEDDYSLWEFYYDPSTDKSMNSAPMQTGMTSAAGNSTNTTAFGASQQTTASPANSLPSSATDPSLTAAPTSGNSGATLSPQ